jgi:hypothetical protein
MSLISVLATDSNAGQIGNCSTHNCPDDLHKTLPIRHCRRAVTGHFTGQTLITLDNSDFLPVGSAAMISRFLLVQEEIRQIKDNTSRWGLQIYSRIFSGRD